MSEQKAICTICKKTSPGKYWWMSKMKFEIFLSGCEVEICPECREAIFGTDYGLPFRMVNELFSKFREQLVEMRGNMPNTAKEKK